MSVMFVLSIIIRSVHRQTPHPPSVPLTSVRLYYIIRPDLLIILSFVDNSKLYLPIGNHLKVFTDSFQYAASAVWNKLPVHVREAESTPAFKSAYIKWFFNKTCVQRFLNDFICF